MFLSTSCFFPAHTKSIMYFSNFLRIWIGIEKISVRYHSLDKIKMLTTCTLQTKSINESSLNMPSPPPQALWAKRALNVGLDLGFVVSFTSNSSRKHIRTYYHSPTLLRSCFMPGGLDLLQMHNLSISYR